MRYRVLTMQQSSAVPRHVCESATVVWECWRCGKWGVISRICEKSWNFFLAFLGIVAYTLGKSAVFFLIFLLYAEVVEVVPKKGTTSTTSHWSRSLLERLRWLYDAFLAVAIELAVPHVWCIFDGQDGAVATTNGRCVWDDRFGDQIRHEIFIRICWAWFMTIRADTDGYQTLPKFFGGGFIAVGFDMSG